MALTHDYSVAYTAQALHSVNSYVVSEVAQFSVWARVTAESRERQKDFII